MEARRTLKPQSIAVGTPFTDQIYAAVAISWLAIDPRPDAWLYQVSSYLPEAHNRLVEDFLNETMCDRLLILEDDIEVDRRIIARCATHRADVVTGVYRARRPPHQGLLYDSLSEDGTGHYVAPERLAGLLRRPGEHPIAGAGTGMISIHRRVLESMSWPWFEPSPGDRASEKRGFGGHDLYFCAKVARAGFRMTVDTHEIMVGKHVGWKSISIDEYIP